MQPLTAEDKGEFLASKRSDEKPWSDAVHAMDIPTRTQK